MTVVDMIYMLSDEFKDMGEEEINDWVEFCSPFVSKKQFGKLYNHALALFVCHKMKMAGLGENTLGDLGKIGNAYSATSVSDGGSSISFASTGAGNLTTNAEFGMTIYGTQYLQMCKTCLVPIHISGEGDISWQTLTRYINRR